MNKIANYRNTYTSVELQDKFKVSKNDGTDDKSITFENLSKQQTTLVMSNKIISDYSINVNGNVDLILLNTNYVPTLEDGLVFRVTFRGLPYNWQSKTNPFVKINGSISKLLINGWYYDTHSIKALDKNTIGNGICEIRFSTQADAWKLYKIGTESSIFEEDTESDDRAGSLVFDGRLSGGITAEDYPMMFNIFGGNPQPLFNVALAGININNSNHYKITKGQLGYFNRGVELGSFTMYNTSDYKEVNTAPLQNSITSSSTDYTLFGYVSNANYPTNILTFYPTQANSIKYQPLPDDYPTNTSSDDYLLTQRLPIYYRWVL